MSRKYQVTLPAPVAEQLEQQPPVQSSRREHLPGISCKAKSRARRTRDECARCVPLHRPRAP
jgi:hypothetical protein